MAVAIAHDLDVHALVVGIRVTVVHPQKRADLHLVACGRHRLVAVGRDAHDLTGTELVGVLVAELVVDERLEGDAVALAVHIAANQHRQAAHAVTCGEDGAVLGHDKQRKRPLDSALGEHDALDQVFLLVDERRHELGVVHPRRNSSP